MEEERLVKSMIANPRIWRLAMRVEPTKLRVMLYCPIEDNSLIIRDLPLATGAPSKLRALEDAIYDNPLLLSDFERVYCVVPASTFLLVPTDMAADADNCEMLFKRAFPDFRGEILSNATGAENATLLLGLDSELSAFLNRTFIAPRITHHLSALSRYFIATAGRGNKAKTFVNLRPSSLDVVIVDRGNLLLANTYAYADINDALYYILAARMSLELEPTGSDELLLTGDSKAREVLMPRLRDYITGVMPMIFPSQMFRAGREAMRAPFDLIVLPLCE